MTRSPRNKNIDGFSPVPRQGQRGSPVRKPNQAQTASPRNQHHVRSSSRPTPQQALPDITLDDELSFSTSQSRRTPPRRRFLNKKALTTGIISVFSILFIGAGFIAWFLQNNILVTNVGDGSAALGEFVDPSTLRGEGDGRVNILLIGIDATAELSDTIILASIDPVASDVALLSVPRDMLVDIPGFERTKINAAHAFGERYGYEGGGPQLLKDTLSETLDVPIHYYGRVDFEGFEQAIDTVGGVEVEVEEDLFDNHFPDDDTGGYEPLHIEAGTHTMEGETALKYARSRYTTSDFDRNRRQQQILVGLKSQALALETLSNPTRVTNLLRSLSSHTQTDLSIEEIMRLIEIAEEVDQESIVQSQLDASEDNFLAFSNYYGQSVLVPTAGDFSEIQEYVRGLLVDSYIKDEQAQISVLNGTQQTGLAAKTGDLLRSFGYRVDKIDNASEQNYTQTVIFDYSGENPYTLRYLEQRFGVSAQRREPPQDRERFDIEIVIGSDYDPSAQ